jgi:hypothetical protein
MPKETPLEIGPTRDHLRQLFTGLIPEAVSGEPEERERNFLSRALAAFAVHKLAGCTVDEAAQSVVDGEGDWFIDAVYYSPTTNTLWITQSKFIADGYGEPDLASATGFKTGLEDLLRDNLSVFEQNAAWRRKIPQIRALLQRGGLQVRAVMVYSGINMVSEDRRRMFEGVKQKFSADSEYLEIVFCGLTTIYDWVSGADRGPEVDEVELRLLWPGWVKQPYETVYGLLPLADLVELHVKHGRRLIGANIRAYKGRTDVNTQISATIQEEPQHFFYLNNGLTAYCHRLEIQPRDYDNSEQKRMTAYRFSIVNGAQTLGSVARYCQKRQQSTPSGYVFVKVISLERCVEDQDFAERISRSTNFQNEINSRDFVALDEQQDRIAQQLRVVNVEYHYKEAYDTPRPDDANFTLEEATTALACLEQEKECDLCSRVLSNRNSLWSFDEVYPEGELYRTRYHRLFRDERSARTVWRAVQAQRSVISIMRDNARSAVGVQKIYYENARWLVLNIVFCQLHPERGEDLKLTEAEHSTISAKTIEVAEALWTACENQGLVSRNPGGGDSFVSPRHFRSVFCSANDCRQLRGATLAVLAARSKTQSPTTSPTTAANGAN